ncbi:hypothetical protein [Peribacillus sp. SCS-37]
MKNAFRCRHSIGAGRAVSLLGFACGGLPVPLLPHEKAESGAC